MCNCETLLQVRDLQDRAISTNELHSHNAQMLLSFHPPNQSMKLMGLSPRWCARNLPAIVRAWSRVLPALAPQLISVVRQHKNNRPSIISELEEDIAEFGLGEPSLERGDPLLLKIIGGQVLLFMGGRKTTTQKCLWADIMHVLREPLTVDIPPILTNATIRGWLSQNGEDPEQVLRQPLRVKLEIGTEVYDSTRDAMVVPMSFWLNDKLLTPTRLSDFPGFENDPTGNFPSNLFVWRTRTKSGSWVPIPRKFTINLCSTTRAVVKGETDSVRFSNILITRRS